MATHCPTLIAVMATVRTIQALLWALKAWSVPAFGSLIYLYIYFLPRLILTLLLRSDRARWGWEETLFTEIISAKSSCGCKWWWAEEGMKGLEQAQHVGTILDKSEYICESSLRCALNRSGLLFTFRVWSIFYFGSLAFISSIRVWILKLSTN